MQAERNDPCPCGSGKKYKKCCYLNPKIDFNINPPELDDYFEDEDGYDDDYTDEYDDDYMEDEDYQQEELITGLNRIRLYLMEKKPHIIEYKKIRALHSEIVNSMAQYFSDGKFKHEITDKPEVEQEQESAVHLFEGGFNLNSHMGAQCFYNLIIYKTVSNMNCITEDFINNNHYKKPEKIEFLHSMLDSKSGLFQVEKTDFEEGYAYLKEVFTGERYRIIDIGLSGQSNYDENYLYTRIITYNNISFSTGLSIIYKKTNPFIIDFIKEHKADYVPEGELERFIQLYNHYSTDPNREKVIVNTLE
jgi:hypothetical protein